MEKCLESNIYQSKEYKRSRKAYILQCMFEYFVQLFVTDAFLAKLLTSIGISNALTGIISSFMTLAFVFQLLSIALVKVKINKKNIVIFFDTISISFFMLLYLVPFIPVGKTGKTILVVLSVLTAYISLYLISSIYYKWANSYVEPKNRATYSANKEIISLLTGMIFTAVAGAIIDKFESIGNLEGAFLFIAVSIFILNVCSFTCMKMIKKEDEEKQNEERETFKVVFDNIFGNKNFRNVIVLQVIWDISRYFLLGFLGTFKTEDLLMTVFAVQVINIVGNFMRMVVSKPFGRYSDKTSYAKGIKLGILLEILAFAAVIFTTKNTWWLIIIHTVLHNCALAGTNQNSFNITYSYVNEKYITQAMAVKNSIGGLAGFVSALVAGKLLAAIQASGNSFLGINVYGQQILAAISIVMMAVCILYIHFVIEKQKVMIQ